MGEEAFLSEQVIGLSESIDDRVAALLQAGTGITLTYNDVAGTLTIAASSSFDGSFAALTGKPTTLSGYGITDAQPLDSDLTEIAALSTTSFGRSLLTQADAAATRSTIGAGTGTIGGSTGSTDNAVLRADGTGGTTLQNSSFVMPDIATASPNNTVNHASLQATGATTNVSASVVPKGSGAFCLAVPDGTSTGGNARGSNAVDLQTSRGAATQVASGLDSVAVGVRNTASNSQAIAIGYGNTVTAVEGKAIGYENTVSGSQGNAIGLRNTVSGPDGATAIGYNNTASNSHAYATGWRAVASIYGQRAHATGFFAAVGDAQDSRFVLRNRTTDATPTTLFTDGSSAVLTLSAGEVIGFLANILGVKSDGSAVAHYVRRGVIKRVGTTTSLAGTIQTIGTDIEDNALTDVSITANDTNETLQIQATGIAGETWRWVAVVEAVDLGFGT